MKSKLTLAIRLSRRSNVSIARFNKMVFCPRPVVAHTMRVPRHAASAKQQPSAANNAALVNQASQNRY